MKTKSLLKILFLSPVLFCIPGCTNRIEQNANEFFKAANEQNYEQINTLSYNSVKDIIAEAAKYIIDEYGEISDFKQYSFKDGPSGGSILASLKYECNCTKKPEVLYVNLQMIQKDKASTPEIVAIYYDTNKDYIDNIEDYNKKSNEVCDKLYEYRMANKYPDLAGLFDPGYLKSGGGAEELAKYIDNVASYYGKITSYQKTETHSEVEKDLPVFKIIVECQTDSSRTFNEELLLKKSGNEFKVFGFKVLTK